MRNDPEAELPDPAARGGGRDRPSQGRFVQGVFRAKTPQEKLGLEPPAPRPASEGDASDDPFRVYLKDMGRYHLLTREGEAAAAQRIEAAKVSLLSAVLTCRSALDLTRKWLSALSDGSMTPSEFFAADPPGATDAEAGETNEASVDFESPQEEDACKATGLIETMATHLEGVPGGSKKGKRPSGATARDVAIQLVRERLEAARFEEIARTFEDLSKDVSAKVRSCPWSGPIPAALPTIRKEGPAALIVRRLRARGEARPQALLDALRTLADAGLEPERFGRLSADIAKARRELSSAKDEMTNSNLRLVISIARRSANRGLAFSDLVQEGNLGLMRAVDKFDHRRGYKFATYATWWIRQAVTRALADQGRVIRVPVHTYEKLGQIQRHVRTFHAEHGRDPTPGELSLLANMPIDQVKRLLSTVPDPVSLDTPVGDDGDASIADVVEDRMSKRPDDILHEGDIRRHILAAMSDLSAREERVIRLRYGINVAEQHTLEQCGEIFGVTRERVRQIEAKALYKLKHPSRAKTLKTLL